MPPKRKAADKETREAREQAREEARLNAISKMRTERANTRFENAVAAIMRKHAMGTADRMKPHKFASLMIYIEVIIT